MKWFQDTKECRMRKQYKIVAWKYATNTLKYNFKFFPCYIESLLLVDLAYFRQNIVLNQV